MSTQIQDSVYMLMASLGRRLKLVSTLNQYVNIFKPLLTMSEKIHPVSLSQLHPATVPSRWRTFSAQPSPAAPPNRSVS